MDIRVCCESACELTGLWFVAFCPDTSRVAAPVIGQFHLARLASPLCSSVATVSPPSPLFPPWLAVAV